MIAIFNETNQPIKTMERKRGDIIISITKEEEKRKKNISILFQPSNDKEKNVFENLDTLVNMNDVQTILELEKGSKMGVTYDFKHFSQTIRTDFKNYHRDVLFLLFNLEGSSLSDIVPTKGLYIHNYFFYKGMMAVIASVDEGVTPIFKFFDEEKKMMKEYTFKKENNKYSLIKEYEEMKEEDIKDLNRFKIRRYTPLKINKYVFVHESNVENLKRLNVIDDKTREMIIFNDNNLLSKINKLKDQKINVATLYLPIDSYRDTRYTNEYKEMTKMLSANFVLCNVLMNDGKVKRR